MHACRAALFASALALSACDSDLPQTPTAPTVPLPGSVPVVNITISPVPVPARRIGSTSTGANRYELEAKVTFSEPGPRQSGPLREITAIVRRLPGGATSGGSMRLNRSLASGPVTQTYTQQFDLGPPDTGAIWVVSAKAGTYQGQEFTIGPVEAAVILEPPASPQAVQK